MSLKKEDWAPRLVLRFIGASTELLGVDFKVRMMEFKGKKLNLRIWDTGTAVKLGTTLKRIVSGPGEVPLSD